MSSGQDGADVGRGIRFFVEAQTGAARLGRLECAHGMIQTPAFMPVGTLGAVKGLGPEQLEQAGASVMLANLYHLMLRPGVGVIENQGGLHAFSGWSRPLLTDSGGFQVFSLGALRKIDADGVTFRSVHDGSTLRLTPENVVEMQGRLGVDIAMMLDECPSWPITEAEASAAWARTRRWAGKAREQFERSGPQPGSLFGIVQGSFFPALRERSVRDLTALDFDGYAIGGVSVGEARTLGREIVEFTAPLLPAERPRYLMGLGTPEDIVHAVGCGIDLFDCVLPARNARHGYLFTRQGPVRIKAARYRTDSSPLDSECRCSACRRCSRAFLHHLYRCEEITAKVLGTMHNVFFYLDFVEGLRKALSSGCFVEAAGALVEPYRAERALASTQEASCAPQVGRL